MRIKGMKTIAKRRKRMKRDPLDDLFSEYIRKRAMARVGGCEKCLAKKCDMTKEDGSIFPAWKQLQCSHFHGRGNHSIRWDEDNAAGLCGGCHMYFTANPSEHKAWFVARLGELGEALLEGRKREGMPDKEAIKIYLKVKLEELSKG